MGKPWDYKIRIGDIIRQRHDGDLSFDEARDQIVARFRASPAIREDSDRGRDLKDLVDELVDAVDVDDFDWVLSDIYDLADEGKFLWAGP